MSEVTRNVIMDLLPLYLAGELSADTSALVEHYIEADSGMKEIIAQMKKAEALPRAPAAFSTEVALKTFQEAKKWTVIRTLGLAVIIGAFTLVCLFMTF